MADPLPKKKVDELWELYQQDHAPHRIKKAASFKVHHSTVTRYIEKGDPKYGIESFKARLKSITKAADKRTAISSATNLDKVRALIKLGFSKMFHEQMVGGKPRLVLKGEPSILELEKLMRLEEFLTGGADSRVEHQMKGELGRVINDVIEAVKRVIKDQKTRDRISHELQQIVDRGAGERGVKEAAATN